MADTNNTKTIIIAVTAIVIVAIIYLIVSKTVTPSHPDEQEAVTCGNKQVYRYIHPSEAFPAFTRDYNSEVSLTADVLKKISDSLGTSSVSVDVKNKVVDLQEKLNQDNITFSTALRSYFMNVNADPCNDTLRQKLLAFTDEMTRRMLELRSATSLVTTIAQTETVTKVGGAQNAVENPATVDTSSGIQSLPPRVIIPVAKETLKLKKSIYQLDELLQTNKNFNHMVTLPSNRLILKKN
jgi:sugar-specific transcriptional regulator TrmB